MEPDARYAKTLYATANAFDEMAKGKYPDRILAMAGMFALRALLAEGRFEQDIVVGEQGLAILADGGTLNLDARGRARAVEIAKTIRLEAFRASQTDQIFDS
jgi:hypothetical protein